MCTAASDPTFSLAARKNVVDGLGTKSSGGLRGFFTRKSEIKMGYKAMVAKLLPSSAHIRVGVIVHEVHDDTTIASRETF